MKTKSVPQKTNRSERVVGNGPKGELLNWTEITRLSAELHATSLGNCLQLLIYLLGTSCTFIKRNFEEGHFVT